MTDKKPSDGAILFYALMVILLSALVLRADTWMELAKPIGVATGLCLLHNS